MIDMIHKLKGNCPSHSVLKRYKKAFNAGRHWVQNNRTTAVILMIGILADSFVTLYGFDSTSGDAIVLKAVLAMSAVFIVDFSPEMLSVIVFQQYERRWVKPICSLTLVTVTLATLFLLGKHRLETVDDMFGASLHLIETATPPGLVTMGWIAALIPAFTSAVIFCQGIVSYNPNKKANDIRYLEVESKCSEHDYKIAKTLYEPLSSEKEPCEESVESTHPLGSAAVINHYDDLNAIVESEDKAHRKQIEYATEENKMLFSKKIAESIGATSTQIETLMEDNENGLKGAIDTYNSQQTSMWDAEEEIDQDKDVA